METQIGTDLKLAKKLLEEQQIVAIPTETVYGLAGNALDPVSVSKIYEAKNRPSFDPLIVHLSSVEEIEKYAAEFPEPAKNFMRAKSPGPVTCILPKNEIIPDITTSGLPKAAFRVPNHPLSLELLQSLDFPLAAPSANPFGYISPTSADHVMDQLGGKIPYILDGGPCKVGIESTIIEWEEGKVIVRRLGGMDLSELEDYFDEVEIQKHSSSNPVSPGQLKSHYAPRKPFYLGDLRDLYSKHKNEAPAIICFQNSLDESPESAVFYLSKKGDTAEAARNLFRLMRELDESDFGCILAEKLPESGLGPAINDRLKRAAAKS